MRNAGLEETQAGIKIAGRNINNPRYVDDANTKTVNKETGEPEEKDGTTWPASCEICMQARKQQLELDIEQQTGSK